MPQGKGIHIMSDELRDNGMDMPEVELPGVEQPTQPAPEMPDIELPRMEQPAQPESEQPAGASEPAEELESALSGFMFHQRKAFEAARKALDALIPPDFKTYSEEARKEFFEAFRVLFERMKAAQERAAAADTPPEQPSTTGKTKVKVEVS